MNISFIQFKENSRILHNALQEDIGGGDHTSMACVDEGAAGKAGLKVKQDGVIAGLVVVDHVFNLVDSGLSVKVLCNEGQVVIQGQKVIEVWGKARSILMAERLVLNCMQRMSGIATLTRKFVSAVKGTKAKITDTRKTTPGMRLLEKWAVVAGGGENHRWGLYDMILVKDNHVDYAGGIIQALKRVEEYKNKQGLQIKVEIETRNLEEVKQVLQAGCADRIMLDNFTPQQLRYAVQLVNGALETEASGGITLDNVRQYAETGVDFISVGALTHSYFSLDMSLKAET